MTEDEMVGWHHQLDGHEFEQALGVGDGQGSLVCCSLWGRKESDSTERLSLHAHRVDDAVQPSPTLSSPSPPTFSLSQHQGLFQGISFMRQVAEVLELQHQSFH